MKAAEVTSRAVEIQRLEEKYREDFQREFRGGVRLCYNQLKIVFEYKIAREKGDISRTSKALDVLKDFLDVSALVSATMSTTAEFAPFIAGASIAVSKIKDYSEGLSREQKLKNYKIFMRIIETAMKYSEQFANDAKIEEFADKILASLEESKFFEHLKETIIMRAKGTWLRHEVAEAREIAGSTLYVSHEPFLFRHYQNIQDVAGIPPKQQKDLETSTNQDVQNVVKYMISHMDNFGINREETDIKVIVDKIISYFSTHARSLEVSHNAAVKIYQALLSSHEKDWHQDEEQQSLMIFQIKYLLRNELKTEILDQIEKNPYYLKLLCRKIVKDLAEQKHAELFVEHEEIGRVADAKKAVAEYVPQIKSKTEFEFQANFLSDQKAIGQFLRDIYQSTEWQRSLAKKLIDDVKSQSVTAYQLGLEITQMLKSGIALDVQDSDGDSLIIIACKNKDLEKAKVILSHQSGKYSVNLFNNKGGTALMYAIKFKQEEIVELLIKNNADVNARLGSDPILHMAIEVRNNKILDLLLSHDKIDIHATNAQSQAAIHKAVLRFYPYAQKKLKALGASDLGHEVAITDASKETEVNVSALHMILLTSTDLAEIDGALLPENSSFKDINDPIGNSGSNILMQNMSHPERHEILKHLVGHPRVKINHNDVDRNILHEALRRLDFDLAKHILDASAKRPTAEQININHKTLSGYSPVHMVVLEMTMLAGLRALSDIESLSTSSMVEYGAEKYDQLYDLFHTLLDMGADINSQLPATSRMDLECCGSSLLHLAIKHKLKDVFNLIIERQEVKLDLCNINQETVLHFAAKSFDIEIKTKILEKFTQQDLGIDAQNKYGNTALHIALSLGNIAFAKELVEMGADINIENTDGHRPLDLAIIEYSKYLAQNLNTENAVNIVHMKDMLDCLMNHENIDLTKPNKNAQTYLHMAVMNNLEGVSEDLLIKGVNISSNRFGCTEITYAAIKGNRGLLTKLLQHEYDPSFLDQLSDESCGGSTPLISAMASRNEEMANMLIEAGASKSLKSLKGKPPISFAIEAKLSSDFITSFFDVVSGEEMEDYLLEKDASDRNILDYTYAYGRGEIIKFMEEKLLSLDQEKLFTRLKVSDFETMSNYYASVAASFGNAEYFKMMSQEALEILVHKGEFGENGEFLADLVLRGYMDQRSTLTKEVKSPEEINLSLKNYIDAIDMLYRPEMTLMSYTKDYLANLGIEHQNPELLAMFMNKNAAALAVTQPTQIDALHFIESVHEVVGNADIHKLQGMESGFHDH